MSGDDEDLWMVLDPYRDIDPGRGYLRGKRVADVAVSGLGLVAASPLMAVIALAIAVDSPGPVLFRQERVGLGGIPFMILKFRTMTTAAPGERRVAVSATGDARVTRVGKVLRASKLDELPQLVNVLRGDMSLVGPRPEVPEYVQQWAPLHRGVILTMRPGITDPASVEFRNESDLLAAQSDPERYYVEELLPRKTARYVDYVRDASWRTDLRVIADTVVAVLRG
ncbi:MAG: sugar transferase [Dermatophilus congolensis]|nr:sugar transferase [Dermatophilus congolensis]